MCETSEIKNTDILKTSYQRAHFYKNVIDDKFHKDIRERSKVRPDLYVYDPIINKKCSTYNKDYGEKISYKKPSEFHGQFYFASKSSYKNIYNDFHSRPVGTLKNGVTTSGIHYDDPRKTVEAKLVDNFNKKALENKVNSFCYGHYKEFVFPYISTSKLHFQDCTESLLNGIAKNDTITYYNKKVKNNIPLKKKVYKVKPKAFFKVPFYGDLSVYTESYRNPAKKDAFLSEVCLMPDYFESIKTEISTIPNTTEQKQIGIKYSYK